MKPGDRIHIIHMDDNGGKDWRASELDGAEGIIDYIDDAGQIHLVGVGLALIPGVDQFELFN